MVLTLPPAEAPPVPQQGACTQPESFASLSPVFRCAVLTGKGSRSSLRAAGTKKAEEKEAVAFTFQILEADGPEERSQADVLAHFDEHISPRPAANLANTASGGSGILILRYEV